MNQCFGREAKVPALHISMIISTAIKSCGVIFCCKCVFTNKGGITMIQL
jgi:hypothetical protein